MVKAVIIERHKNTARSAAYWRITGEINKARRCDEDLEVLYKEYPKWEDDLYTAEEEGRNLGASDWRSEMRNKGLK